MLKCWTKSLNYLLPWGKLCQFQVQQNQFLKILMFYFSVSIVCFRSNFVRTEDDDCSLNCGLWLSPRVNIVLIKVSALPAQITGYYCLAPPTITAPAAASSLLAPHTSHTSYRPQENIIPAFLSWLLIMWLYELNIPGSYFKWPDITNTPWFYFS